MSAPADGEPTPRAGKGRIGRRVGALAILAAIVVVPLMTRLVWEGRGELAAAAEAAQAGRIDEQIIHLGRAARLRVPLAGHDERAIAELLALAKAQREPTHRDPVAELAAYREVRGAILATRAWGVADPASLDEANRNIAALMAVEAGEPASEARYLTQLEQLPGPPIVGAKLAALGFVACAGCCVGFVVFGIDAAGRLRPRSARRWGGASLVLLVVWMLLLRWPELVG